MRTFYSLTITCVAALISTTAFAQQLGSRLPGPSGSMVQSSGYPDDDAIGARPSDEAVKVMRGMAKCVVTHKRADAERYLTSHDEVSRRSSYARFSGLMPTCLSNVSFGASKLEMSASSLSGALAEALLSSQILPALTAEEPSATDMPYWLSSAADQRIVQEMAICLVTRFPQQTLALVGSDVGSAAERTAFAVLTPSMGSCLVSGASLHANRSGIRLALAGALYHRIKDPAAPAPEKK